MDHGDHVHYYRTKIRSVGDIQGPRPRHIRSDPAVTAVTFNDGTTQMFERPQLEDGAVGEGRPVAGAAKSVPVIPYEEHLLVPGAGVARDTVEIRDREGALTASVDAKCPQPRGDAVTRRGVIFGCADGALLVTAKDGRFDGEKIPYGRPVADSARPHDFRHRSGSTTLTATAGGDAVWILDVTKRTWKLVKTGPVVAVNTAGEGAPLLALTSNGVLQAIDPVTAKVVADTELLTGRKPGPHAVIEVDTNRAYLNDATGRKIYEIDYNDNLRLARTFPVDITPSHMVETGR
ncbi:hypothetical protein [Kribbella flavida]|uniref:hypothetical protein n=1 Tax=Kribbella flavida TaxID=182640 RepID=UPI00192B7907|nr:hypothetical protein [Kribbella flavida]